MATISVVRGKGSLVHNNRKGSNLSHVDKSKTKDNIIYTQKNLKEFYNEIFGESVAEYNAKQKRADRKIENYFDKIKKSNNGEKLFHEIVVQIGDKDMTDVERRNSIKSLDQYAREFEKRYPNLKVVNSVMHLDEATPHLHIDFIPVGKGYKTGLKTRNSLSKGLGNKDLTIFYDSEREYLTTLAQENEIDIEVKGKARGSLKVPEYKKQMKEMEILKEELKMLETSKNALKNEIREEEEVKYNVESEIKALRGDLTNLETFDATHTPKITLGRVSVGDFNKLKQAALDQMGETTELRSENETLKNEIKQLNLENQKLHQTSKRLRHEKEDLTKLYEEEQHENGLYQAFVELLGYSDDFERVKPLVEKVRDLAAYPFNYTLEQFKKINQQIKKVFDREIEMEDSLKDSLKKELDRDELEI